MLVLTITPSLGLIVGGIAAILAGLGIFFTSPMTDSTVHAFIGIMVFVVGMGVALAGLLA